MTRGYAAIGLYRPKCELNVGGAMRAAMCYGAALIMVQGCRYRHQAADTQKAYRHIPLVHHDDIRQMFPMDCTPVVLECVDGAQDLRIFKHPERAIYLFGPEDGNVPAEWLAYKNVVRAPTRFCMNLAATVNVVLYDRSLKRSAK